MLPQRELLLTALSMAVRLAALDGVPDALLTPPEAFADRVAGYVADFVEPAKVAALEDLDEGRKALGVATSWLRRKLAAGPTELTAPDRA